MGTAAQIFSSSDPSNEAVYFTWIFYARYYKNCSYSEKHKGRLGEKTNSKTFQGSTIVKYTAGQGNNYIRWTLVNR